MSESSSGGCPCLHTGVDLAIGFRAPSGVPLPWLRPRRCTRLSSPDRCPGVGSLEKVLSVPPVPYLERPALSGRRTGRGHLATDRPDEGRELTCDRGDGDGLGLALPDQRPVARAQAALRLPGDLANRSWRRRH